MSQISTVRRVGKTCEEEMKLRGISFEKTYKTDTASTTSTYSEVFNCIKELIDYKLNEETVTLDYLLIILENAKDWINRCENEELYSIQQREVIEKLMKENKELKETELKKKEENDIQKYWKKFNSNKKVEEEFHDARSE